jgi:hypothetical protein
LHEALELATVPGHERRVRGDPVDDPEIHRGAGHGDIRGV